MISLQAMPIRRQLSFIVLSILLSLTIYSSSFAEYQVFTAKLDNGLTVILLEDHHSPIIAMEIVYNVGTKNEQRGLTGLASICHEILKYGTDSFPRGRAARIIQAGGGYINYMRNREYTVISSNFASNMLDTVLRIEADRMQNTKLTFEKLILAKEIVGKARQMGVEGSLYGPLNEELFNLHYCANPYANPKNGWPDDVKNISFDDVKNFYRDFFIPSNAYITIAGDFNANQVKEKISELFGVIISKPVPKQRNITEPKRYGERIGIIYDRSPVPALASAYLAPPSKKPEEVAIMGVITQILSQGESSRLHKRLVEEDLAIATGGGQVTLSGPGIVFYWAIGNYDASIDDMNDIFLEELAILRKKLVSPDELEKAKNKITADYYRGIRNLGGLVTMLAYNHIIFNDWRYMTKYVDLAQEVTAKDIQDIADKYLTVNGRTTVMMMHSDDKAIGGESD